MPLSALIAVVVRHSPSSLRVLVVRPGRVPSSLHRFLRPFARRSVGRSISLQITDTYVRLVGGGPTRCATRPFFPERWWPALKPRNTCRGRGRSRDDFQPFSRERPGLSPFARAALRSAWCASDCYLPRSESAAGLWYTGSMVSSYTPATAAPPSLPHAVPSNVPIPRLSPPKRSPSRSCTLPRPYRPDTENRHRYRHRRRRRHRPRRYRADHLVPSPPPQALLDTVRPTTVPPSRRRQTFTSRGPRDVFVEHLFPTCSYAGFARSRENPRVGLRPHRRCEERNDATPTPTLFVSTWSSRT